MKSIPPPKDAYRIAHRSGLHLTGVNRDFECSLALVEDATANGAEHLIISGDLVESGEMRVLKSFVAALKYIVVGRQQSPYHRHPLYHQHTLALRGALVPS